MMISDLLFLMGGVNHSISNEIMVSTPKSTKGSIIIKQPKSRPKEDDVPAYEHHSIKELNKMLMYGEI